MAIYSFNHDSFGKTTSRAGAAGGNAAYNARESETKLGHANGSQSEAARVAAYNAREEATYAVRSHVIPPGPKEAEAWFRQQEKADRKNARMSDRFIAALPRELTPGQCIGAVESFCRGVTQDRIPWHFALHLELDQKNEPDWNPHAHIIFRDRDIETGRRYLYTSAGPKERYQLAAKGVRTWSTSDLRVAWNDTLNRELERAGIEARVDHRSLKEQGIDREPQIHTGPGSQKAAEKGHRFASRDHQYGERTIPYSLLDNGTRAAHNAHIRERNASREAAGHWQSDPRTAGALNARVAGKPPRNPHEEELRRLREAQSEERRTMLREQRRDRDALRGAHAVQWNQHKAWAKELYAGARQAAFEQVKERNADRWKQVQAIQNREDNNKAAEALKLEQKALYQKLSAGRVAEARVEKNAAWEAVKQQQAKERLALRQAHREEARALIRQHTAERLALKEQHRVIELQRDASRIAARVNGHQGMPSQQKAALQTIRLKQEARAAAAKGADKERPSPGRGNDPRALQQTAAAERDRRTTIRSRLDGQRQTNRLVSGPPSREPARQRTANRTRTEQANQQSQVQQAVMSGTATSSDRASAPAELREIIARQERRAAQRSMFRDRTASRQEQGRGRAGGGRGR